ncbi:methyltransferase TRM13-domain-containing protein [Lipomyces japonicus]|uniref:methyltransferase TRM13-domain-containing protein n=1 Tax=Lipomyces japonicus TaxID=56871 RepID=UPI0034CED818
MEAEHLNNDLTSKKRRAKSPASEPKFKQLSTPERLQCEYLLPHKRFRRCNMTRRATEKFCAQHLSVSDDHGEGTAKNNTRTRVKCPLDPGHSVWLNDLSRHLKRCQKSKEKIHATWFRKDFNVLRPHPNVISDNEVIMFDEYQKWITFVERFYEHRILGTKYADIPNRQLSHDGLEKRLNELSNKKHAVQQGSLAAQLEFKGLLTGDYCFVEFGAGRGELSRYLHQSILYRCNNAPSSRPRFLLIDRSGMRMKLDSKIVKDAEEFNSTFPNPEVKRIKCDIKDLDLKLETLFEQQGNNNDGLVAVSKHLCGAASDLTFQCLFNYANEPNHIPIKGVMIALCCRHRCLYSSYPLEYIVGNYNDSIIDPRGFEIITKMSSWAVCGRRPRSRVEGDQNALIGDAENDADDEAFEDEDHNHERDDFGLESAQTHPSGRSIAEREEIGFKVRALLDYGRVRNLEDKGYQVELVKYVDRSVSGENVCLLAIPKS